MLANRPVSAEDAIEALLHEPWLEELTVAHRVIEPRPLAPPPFPPLRARRSATTCRSSTPSRRTRPPAPSTSFRPRPSPRPAGRAAALAEAALGLKTPHLRRRHPAERPAAVRAAGHRSSLPTRTCSTPAILPHHTKWFKLFENLQFVVIDELHTYRGIFGSHVANVVRRLRRICNHYGSDPVFICASATIANPRRARRARAGGTGRAHRRERRAVRPSAHILVVNPPVANEQLGIRGSALLTGQHLAERLIGGGVQTIAFARSRTAVEVLTTYLRETFCPAPRPSAHDPRLPRRLPPERAARDRGGPARRPRARRGRHQRPRAGDRHRQPRRRHQRRLPRHDRQHLAADGSRRPPDRDEPLGAHLLVGPDRPVPRRPSGVPVRSIAGARAWSTRTTCMCS